MLGSLPMVVDGSQPEFAEEMRQLFETNATRLIDDIDIAFAEADAGKLLQSLHTLKSSSAQVGALELSALVARIELALRSGAAMEHAWRLQLGHAWQRLESVWRGQSRMDQAVAEGART